MSESGDTNAEIWKSADVVKNWAIEAKQQERRREANRRFLAQLLPFETEDAFTFLDLGAGTGAASRVILDHYPHSSAVLADFSTQMMSEGEHEMHAFDGRYSYVEFDMLTGVWPDDLPSAFDAAVTSMCVHHLPDRRKQGLFAEIFDHLKPGGWYFNYDPVTSPDPDVEATWQRVTDLLNPAAAAKRVHRNHEEQARWDNHVRYLIPLDQQLEYLRAAGFAAIDVYWKQLDTVIYGGLRPT